MWHRVPLYVAGSIYFSVSVVALIVVGRWFGLHAEVANIALIKFNADLITLVALMGAHSAIPVLGATQLATAEGKRHLTAVAIWMTLVGLLVAGLISTVGVLTGLIAQNIWVPMVGLAVGQLAYSLWRSYAVTISARHLVVEAALINGVTWLAFALFSGFKLDALFFAFCFASVVSGAWIFLRGGRGIRKTGGGWHALVDSGVRPLMVRAIRIGLAETLAVIFAALVPVLVMGILSLSGSIQIRSDAALMIVILNGAMFLVTLFNPDIIVAFSARGDANAGILISAKRIMLVTILVLFFAVLWLLFRHPVNELKFDTWIIFIVAGCSGALLEKLGWNYFVGRGRIFSMPIITFARLCATVASLFVLSSFELTSLGLAAGLLCGYVASLFTIFLLLGGIWKSMFCLK